MNNVLERHIGNARNVMFIYVFIQTETNLLNIISTNSLFYYEHRNFKIQYSSSFTFFKEKQLVSMNLLC